MDTEVDPLEKTEKPISITAEVAAGQNDRAGVARTAEELFGEVAKSHHKEFLGGQIAWRLQAEAEGGVPEETRSWPLAVARDAPCGFGLSVRPHGSFGGGPHRNYRTASNHDSRLPMPGGLLAKEHKGENRTS